MIYPKKKPMAAFGLDLSQLKLKDTLQEGNAVSSVGQLAGGLVKRIGKSDLGYGVEHTAGAAKIGGNMISDAANGANMLKGLGPQGAAIGAIGGAAIGLGKGLVDTIKNNKDKAYMVRDAREMEAIVDNNNQGVSTYNELEQKSMMEKGGEVPDGEDQETDDNAVILGGKRHKDGGNDIVDETGEKVAETEREELLFTKDQTQRIEESISKIEAGDEEEYFNLGSYVKEIILNRTQDDSGKFKQLNDADLSEQE